MSVVHISGSAHDDIANQNFDYRTGGRWRDCLMTARRYVILARAQGGVTPAKQL
ncbi:MULTISPECIES: hypothetical protein [unclassified Shinella]|jgi:hypothetical protein|uniref:hypothetical protein n=1 Tax=unclassified Shinella TaxID=2643062 RepID=UPI001FDA6A84|nr:MULTISPECIES: hypothetical protein [unclassified Shinella]MCA0342337.1 hypothetical protein [Pseudomonadota bacterium]